MGISSRNSGTNLEAATTTWEALWNNSLKTFDEIFKTIYQIFFRNKSSPLYESKGPWRPRRSVCPANRQTHLVVQDNLGKKSQPGGKNHNLKRKKITTWRKKSQPEGEKITTWREKITNWRGKKSQPEEENITTWRKLWLLGETALLALVGWIKPFHGKFFGENVVCFFLQI